MQERCSLKIFHENDLNIGRWLKTKKEKVMFSLLNYTISLEQQCQRNSESRETQEKDYASS
jgi:hypothetical protein